MGYLNFKSAKKWPEFVYLKKSCHYLKKLHFVYNHLKKRFYWYREILQFSGVFDFKPVVWAMWTVNLQKIWSKCVYLINIKIGV